MEKYSINLEHLDMLENIIKQKYKQDRKYLILLNYDEKTFEDDLRENKLKIREMTQEEINLLWNHYYRLHKTRVLFEVILKMVDICLENRLYKGLEKFSKIRTNMEMMKKFFVSKTQRRSIS